MNELIASICLFAGCGLFIAKRLLRYLHVFQLEEYKSGRFLTWLWKNHSFDKRGSLIALLAVITTVWSENVLIPSACAAVALALYAGFEPDPRRLAKVPLKFTERAHRIYQTAAAFLIFLELILFALFADDLPLLWATQILVMQTIPLFLTLACICLQPDENRRQQAFIDEAKAILKRVDPYIIGITGSYGKTSTKEALGQILQVTLGPTFWTEKSINTVMGITRAIREQLKKGTRFGVIEMGAYVQGSIDKLCALTPPHAAIITSVGVAHLERFGSEETILKAKSELAQNVPYEGILVCNGDNVGARRIAQENPKKTRLPLRVQKRTGCFGCVDFEL